MCLVFRRGNLAPHTAFPIEVSSLDPNMSHLPEHPSRAIQLFMNPRFRVSPNLPRIPGALLLPPLFRSPTGLVYHFRHPIRIP